MRHDTGSAATLLFTLAVLVGCEPEKKLPDKEPSTTHPSSKASTPSFPTTSQPEARKVIEQAIKAATEGHPGRLDRARVNRAVLKGTMEWPGAAPGQTVAIATTRRIDAVWPDRARAEFEMSAGRVRRVVMGVRPQGGWQQARGEDNQATIEELNNDARQIVAVDLLAEHWLPLLVPAADPRGVAFDARKVSFGKNAAGQEVVADVVKLSLPGYPVFTLWFDDKTALLGRIEYTHLEGLAEFRKAVVLTGHKLQGGVMVPGLIESRRNDRVVQQWKLESWEFPERIEEATFEQPK